MKRKACDVCRHSMEHVHRVHAGLRYCSKCYYRCFKSKPCASCGQSARLFVTDPNAICNRCLNKRPCVRCCRVSSSISKLTPQGPVCPSCYKYFSAYKVCEVCGTEDRAAARAPRLWGDKIVCTKCARIDYQSCSRCNHHRICNLDEVGKPTCALCRNESPRQCNECRVTIPAGLGLQCRKCQERKRLRHLGYGLAELLVTHECREAFRSYVNWLNNSPWPGRVSRTLNKHVEFFMEVERRELKLDDGPKLLYELGTPFLRRHLMVSRWLEEARSCDIDKNQRANASDRVRLKKAVSVLPERSAARSAADQFSKELSDAVSDGKITIRTARLSMRPAVDLLKRVQRSKALAITQDDLLAYLRDRPGQRAAISRFIGFVKRNYALDLVLPRSAQLSKLPFSGSDEAVRLLLRTDVRDAEFERDWLRLMLVHLHRLSERTANRVISRAEISEVEGGYQCCLGVDIYWLPRPSALNLNLMME